MYIPVATDPSSHATRAPNYIAIPTSTLAAYARQIANTAPIAHTTSSVQKPGAEHHWYEGAWVVPVAWALAFYCVMSVLMLCTLYGQGILDSKLNYVPRRVRRLRSRIASSASDLWQGDPLVDGESDNGDSTARRYRGMVEDNSAYRALRQQILVERYLRYLERHRAANEDGDGRDAQTAELVQTRHLAGRLEIARVERALATAGVL